MAVTDEEASFHRAIDAAPGDLLPVCVFADRLTELGRGDEADALRWCAAEGRRPCERLRPAVTTGAGAVLHCEATWFWVTAGEWVSSVRRAAPVRPQRSWLPGFYFGLLAGERLLPRQLRNAWAWVYPSASAAYGDFARAWHRLATTVRDPRTGRSVLPPTGSRWRDESRRVIAATLAALPAGATPGDKKKALHDSYPFGERDHWPYRMWCECVREALGVRRVAKQYIPVAGDAGPSLFGEA
jgi:uncharacterized protein (TIGR02996 family)